MSQDEINKKSLVKKGISFVLVIISTWLIVAGLDRLVLAVGNFSITASGVLYLSAVIMLIIPTRTIYYIGKQIGDGLKKRIAGNASDYPEPDYNKIDSMNKIRKEQQDD